MKSRCLIERKLRKRQEAELDAVEPEMLTWFFGVTGKDRIRTEEVRGMLDVWEINPVRAD